MTAATLAHPSTFVVSSGFGFQPIRFRKDNGNLVVQGQAVFRSGTFRDSMGTQNTWEKIHMEQLVANFDYLRANHTLEHIPVRDGHPGWLINGTPGTGAVVGWHTGLVVEEMTSPIDGETYSYLLANYELIAPYAIENVSNGLWRNRSSEIMGYSTNAEAEFWPVYGGFAFVDIPAVEGLNFSRAPGAGDPAAGTKFIVMLDKEIPVTQPAAGTPAATQQAGAPQLPFSDRFSAPAQQTPSAPAASAPSFVFSVNGQATSDFAAVQRHISTLETFATEQREAGRINFINGLLEKGVFLASQKDNLVDLAKTQNDQQWALWTAAFADAQPTTVLQSHGASASMAGQPQNQSGGAQAPVNDELEVAKQTVAMHRMGTAMSEAALKETASYRKLVAAGVEKA